MARNRRSIGTDKRNWYKTSGHASSLARSDMMDEASKMRKANYRVSQPYRNRLDGQRVWTIKYQKKRTQRYKSPARNRGRRKRGRR